MNDNHDHKSCPFCGIIPTDVRENGYWTGMRSNLLSVEINHHCRFDLDDPFNVVHMKVRGRDLEAAWKTWNRRFTK